MNELKPCPLCGCKPKKWEYSHGTIIECHQDKHRVQANGKTFDEAVEEWNRKVKDGCSYPNRGKERKMQIVIDIPEDYYKVLKSIPDWQASADTLLIQNGTPLPKGHGRLIDADAFVWRSNYCYARTGYELMAIDIEDEATIIEADKENKE